MKLSKGISRRDFVKLTAAGACYPLFRPLVAQAQAATQSSLFWVKGIPDQPFVARRKTLYHTGVDTLLDTMGSNGLKFYLYHWRLPFRLRFYNVPSFGEQHAYDPMGNAGHQFVFDDRLPPQVIDFTKDETSGGLNAALGVDVRASRSFGVEAEGRAHLLFSSGKGADEDPADDQPYLDNISFLRLQATLYYRF